MGQIPPGITVYNLPTAPPIWDKLGIFYITWAVAWTTLVFSGMAFCWINRKSPILKIRGLPLSFGAIILLHSYWILAQITYPIAHTMPLVLAYDIQFFFMGIYFPLGIALFHASNLRFLHVAKLQKQFTHPDLLRPKTRGCDGAKTSLLCRLRNMAYTKRIMSFISIGMVLLTVACWFAVKKYHPTYGLPGTEMKSTTLPEQVAELGRGWEWWPSLGWQFIWTWIVAPILIYRAWSIRDTLGWRAQTIGCCLSSLHATPMFLIASYVPAFDQVNMYFSQSQWIHLSIMMFEIFTVFVPVVQVIRLWMLNKWAADINAKWETESQASTLRSSSALSMAERGKTMDFSDSEMGDRVTTMKALEHVLAENPAPLLEFSAHNDFSGENIAFLTRADRWRTTWSAEKQTDDWKIQVYNAALDIYTEFISPLDAEFPLNLPSADLKKMQSVFEKPARILRGVPTSNPATPFDFEGPLQHNRSGSETDETSTQAQYTGDIPTEFNETIFDTVQSHIKYLVFTNTWPKFISEMQSRRKSEDTSPSIFTAASKTTIGSRISSKISSIISLVF
ncbi:Regulator of G protein signaling superfamily [Cordyceps fumosorosea ARSEF 2679]|uniref:Regulator of G protein signaling superfamily n=1 Tax=Cordyceps fumosorosea (strain ARSEF 2679) TaxID=1081104 RepID=A0A167V747_CORFA|nr:Regulator of G protein signaling superfamily [Cordyceps fumosorosea ARSEF 2679]OAA62295.1 Regulator of G protein signaling superfamily [Cordyceps fumosorosea ARSEF 2679]